MSLTEIEIHFERMKELSGSLTQTAAGLYGIVDTAGISAAAQIKAAWTGSNADAFARKEVRILEQIRESARRLEALSVQIEEKAEQIYRLETWNALTDRARSYR